MGIERVFEKVLDRAMLAGWVRYYTNTEGKGIHVKWTVEGAERSVTLKMIVNTFRLMDSDLATVGFDKLAHGETPPDGWTTTGEVDAEILRYFAESVDQLGFHDCEDELLVMVHLVNGWAPEGFSPIEFGEKG